MVHVQIVETNLIRPSTPPFTQDHVLRLSYLDTDPNLDVTFRYLRVYLNRPTETRHPRDDPYHVISSALSSALRYYYPLASTLRRGSGDRRLKLHCTAGQGVPLVRATADCTLQSINCLDDADPGFVEQLVPDPDPDESLLHPCMLQITVFRCGGFSLGAAIHHAMCDGLGATQFFCAVAELARGEERVSVEPVWMRDVLLEPGNPCRVEAPIGEHLCEKGYSPYIDGDHKENGEFVRECFHVREEWLDRLKALLLENSGRKFTTFEALGAFIWRAKVKASSIPREQTVKFAYSTNVRKLINPPLPNGYWGNACVPIYAQLTVQDLLQKPIWQIAQLINLTKRNASDEYVRSFIDFHAHRHGDGDVVSAGRNVSGFTDWRHLGHSSVDFGWGGPANVLPLSRKLLGSVEACFFLGYSESESGSREGGGVRVLVNLKERWLHDFREEMEKLGRLEFE